MLCGRAEQDSRHSVAYWLLPVSESPAQTIHRQNVPAWVVQLFSAKGQVYRRSCAEKGRVAENRFGEAIQVEKSESGGGLIRWKKYVWQQHGDRL
jgi:hypothetical protein